MCPLRIILVFLSATLAGFFLFRNFNSQTPLTDHHPDSSSPESSSSSTTRLSKVLTLPSLSFRFYSTVVSGFWTCVDMASGRYLWRHLTAASSSSPQARDSSD
ncbi:hypothetical protein LINGRAHAP2_LOCUS22720 [Linum grandiflorum]